MKKKQDFLRKLLIFSFVALLTIGLPGCGNGEKDNNHEDNHTTTAQSQEDSGELILSTDKVDLSAIPAGSAIMEYDSKHNYGNDIHFIVFKPLLLDSTVQALDNLGYTYLAIVQVGGAHQDDISNWIMYLPKETSIPIQIRVAPEGVSNCFQFFPNRFVAETEEEIELAERICMSSDHSFNDELTSTVDTDHEAKSQEDDIDFINYIN